MTNTCSFFLEQQAWTAANLTFSEFISFHYLNLDLRFIETGFYCSMFSFRELKNIQSGDRSMDCDWIRNGGLIVDHMPGWPWWGVWEIIKSEVKLYRIPIKSTSGKQWTVRQQMKSWHQGVWIFKLLDKACPWKKKNKKKKKNEITDI